MFKHIAILILLVGVAVAAPKPVKVGVKSSPAAAHIFGTTAPGGTLTVARTVTTVYADGTTTIALAYSSASGNVHVRTLTVAADGSKVTDNFGAVLATPAPAGLVSAISAFATQLDTMIGNAAGAGKLNL